MPTRRERRIILDLEDLKATAECIAYGLSHVHLKRLTYAMSQETGKARDREEGERQAQAVRDRLEASTFKKGDEVVIVGPSVTGSAEDAGKVLWVEYGPNDDGHYFVSGGKWLRYPAESLKPADPITIFGADNEALRADNEALRAKLASVAKVVGDQG